MEAIQEAKTIRGNLLQKSEIAYSKVVSKAMALRSSQSVAIHREQIRLMQELEEQCLREESKSHHNFLSTYQTALHHSPQPFKENFATSHHTLLGCSPPLPPSIQPIRAPPVEEQPSAAVSPLPAPKQSPLAKKVASYARATGEHI